MGTAAQSRARVEELLEELERLYGTVPVNQRTVSLPAERYELACEAYEDGSVDTYVEIENADGEVLHVEDELPGAVGSPGEALESEVRQAVASRTGVEFDIDGLAEVTIVGIGNADDPDEPILYRLLVVYDASYEGGEPPADAEWRPTAAEPTPV